MVEESVAPGEGSFGAVFKASVKATDAMRAVKRIPLPKQGARLPGVSGGGLRWGLVSFSFYMFFCVFLGFSRVFDCYFLYVFGLLC